SGPGGLHSSDTYTITLPLPFSPFHIDVSTRYHYGWTINNGPLDTLTTIFSHELIEAVTDPEGTAIQVNPRNSGPGGSWNEISDGEAMNYAYRLNGSLVQSYWSQRDGRFVVPTGQAQNFFVSSTGVLTVNGDQLSNRSDFISVNADG